MPGIAAYADQSLVPQGAIADIRSAANMLEQFGREGDIYIVHAAEGETVVPMEVLEKSPRLKKMLFAQMQEMGLAPERYVIGNKLNSINPVTGKPEFFFKKLFGGKKNVFKKAAPILGAIAGSFIAPGIGSAIGGALGSLGIAGSAAIGKIAGSALGAGIGSFGASKLAGLDTASALRGAGLSGLTAGLFKGIAPDSFDNIFDIFGGEEVSAGMDQMSLPGSTGNDLLRPTTMPSIPMPLERGANLNLYGPSFSPKVAQAVADYPKTLPGWSPSLSRPGARGMVKQAGGVWITPEEFQYIPKGPEPLPPVLWEGKSFGMDTRNPRMMVPDSSGRLRQWFGDASSNQKLRPDLMALSSPPPDSWAGMPSKSTMPLPDSRIMTSAPSDFEWPLSGMPSTPSAPSVAEGWSDTGVGGAPMLSEEEMAKALGTSQYQMAVDTTAIDEFRKQLAEQAAPSTSRPALAPDAVKDLTLGDKMFTSRRALPATQGSTPAEIRKNLWKVVRPNVQRSGDEIVTGSPFQVRSRPGATMEEVQSAVSKARAAGILDSEGNLVPPKPMPRPIFEWPLSGMPSTPKADPNIISSRVRGGDIALLGSQGGDNLSSSSQVLRGRGPMLDEVARERLQMLAPKNANVPLRRVPTPLEFARVGANNAAKEAVMLSQEFPQSNAPKGIFGGTMAQDAWDYIKEIPGDLRDWALDPKNRMAVLFGLGGAGLGAYGAWDEAQRQKKLKKEQEEKRKQFAAYVNRAQRQFTRRYPRQRRSTMMAQEGGGVPGQGLGDIVPAMLEPGEFVMTRRAVKGAGNGSQREGIKRMYAQMRELERIA